MPLTKINLSNSDLKLLTYFSLLFMILFSSCANQLPPGGGEDDKMPPEIKSIIPRAGTVNFKGRSVKIVFNEYVDRRSFEEAFFISPKPKGKMNFDWSGKEVEVEFSGPFDINRTYVIYVGKDLKDVNGGNTLTVPLTFAFSTGSRIDDGLISGNVLAENYDRVKVMLFLKAGKSAEQLDPQKNEPDYVLQVSPDGSFEFTNLPDGDYRIFAITDEDRNNLYDPDLDLIAVHSDDFKLSANANDIRSLNFLLMDPEAEKNSDSFINSLSPDSIGYIYSNISEDEKKITPDYKFYFYFSNNNLPKQEIVNNFTVKDTASGETNRQVFNWINDSLLEIFPLDNYKPGNYYTLKIDLIQTGKKYLYERNFETASKEEFATITGGIKSDIGLTGEVFIKLYNKENRFITYSKKINDTVQFIFEEVLEGKYILFSFMDSNGNGVFDKGKYFPFRAAESFIIYEKDLNVKGGWNVENVFLKY